MNNKAILEELTRQIKTLESHIKRLKEKPEKLHDLDVEVMGDKLKEMYTLVYNLLPEEELEAHPEFGVRSSEVEKVPLVEVKPEPEIPEPKAPEMSSEFRVPSAESKEEEIPKIEEQVTNTEHRTPNTEEREAEIEIEEKNGEEASPQPSAPNPIPPAVSEQPPAPSPEPQAPEPEPAPRPSSPETTEEPAKTTADLFSGPKTIADTFQAKEDKSIAATVNPQPAQDLKMAIGINEKFLFINELFQGDPSVYNQAIENMNTAGGLVQAISTLDKYRAEYNWADNSEAYHRLKKIINSKYNG
jgi:hypothetical protein